MAGSNDVKVAADAVALAKATYAAATAAHEANEAIVTSMVTAEQAVLEAASAALSDATIAARATIAGYDSVVDAVTAAGNAVSVAVSELQLVAETYDGT